VYTFIVELQKYNKASSERNSLSVLEVNAAIGERNSPVPQEAGSARGEIPTRNRRGGGGVDGRHFGYPCSLIEFEDRYLTVPKRTQKGISLHEKISLTHCLLSYVYIHQIL
jgi:hypothetical protein